MLVKGEGDTAYGLLGWAACSKLAGGIYKACAINKKAACALLSKAAVRQRSFSVQAPEVLLTS